MSATGPAVPLSTKCPRTSACASISSRHRNSTPSVWKSPGILKFTSTSVILPKYLLCVEYPPPQFSFSNLTRAPSVLRAQEHHGLPVQCFSYSRTAKASPAQSSLGRNLKFSCLVRVYLIQRVLLHSK